MQGNHRILRHEARDPTPSAALDLVTGAYLTGTHKDEVRQSHELLLGPDGAAERSREREAERERRRLLQNLDSLRQIGAGREGVDGARDGSGDWRSMSQRQGEGAGSLGSAGFSAGARRDDSRFWQSESLGGMEAGGERAGGYGGSGDTDGVSNSREGDAREPEPYAFETVAFQSLQWRLEPLEVRAARVAARKRTAAAS